MPRFYGDDADNGVAVKKTIKIALAGLGVLTAFGLAFGSYTVVGATERGIKVTLGKISSDVYEPGLHFKAPIISTIQTYDMTNIGFKQSFSIGDDAAVSKDLQSIGVDFQMYWTYNPNKIVEIATNYKTTSMIQEPLSAILKQVVKDEIGRWTIQEIVQNQTKVSDNIKAKLVERASILPINIKSVTLSNFNWSKEYEAMVQKTMIRKQEVDQMKQEVALIEQSAQKRVREAEADKKAAELKAQSAVLLAKGEADAAVTKAEGEAKAKKLRADAESYEAKQIVENEQAYQKRWDFEVRKIHESRWNGVLVPTYIPLTAAGGIVNLKP